MMTLCSLYVVTKTSDEQSATIFESQKCYAPTPLNIALN